MASKRRKIAVRVVAVLAISWLGFFAFMYRTMCQTPDHFAQVMAKLPEFAYFLMPFETMWTRARAGHLQVGDQAPDFALTKLDKSGQLQLASLNQHQPVVLIFGSYT